MIMALRDGIILGTMFGAGVVIDEKTMLPIGTLTAICGLVWWLGRKLQKIDDKLEVLDETVKGLRCVRDKKCEVNK